MNTTRPVAAIDSHPLLSEIPADQLEGTLLRVIPIQAGVITVVATPNSEYGDYEVTSWRPLTDQEIALDRQEFPGQALPAVQYVTARTLPDESGIDAAISSATDTLTDRLAREAAEAEDTLAA